MENYIKDFARDLRRKNTTAERLLWENLRKNELGRYTFRRQLW